MLDATSLACVGWPTEMSGEKASLRSPSSRATWIRRIMSSSFSLFFGQRCFTVCRCRMLRLMNSMNRPCSCLEAIAYCSFRTWKTVCSSMASADFAVGEDGFDAHPSSFVKRSIVVVVCERPSLFSSRRFYREKKSVGRMAETR